MSTFTTPPLSTSDKNSENIIELPLPTLAWGFLNILYRPTVKKTITAHMAKFFIFIVIR
jgi:hypothetical protein